MLVLVYLAALVMAFLTLGFAVLAVFGPAVSLEPIWYKTVFAVGGAYGLGSLWWIWATTIFLLQKQRRHAVPVLIKIGAAAGFSFSLFLIFYPWLRHAGGNVDIPFPVGVLCFMTIPCATAIHLICLLREPRRERYGAVPHFLDDWT
jgi:hypothetical protein